MATEIKLIQSKTEKLLYSIGQQLRAVREEKKMTREDLEERSGVSLFTIKRIEKGESINLGNFIQIALALEIDFEALFINECVNSRDAQVSKIIALVNGLR